MLHYRPCVVAVVSNQEGKFLVGERSDQPGAWQLPQGGIDLGESAEKAVLRELREEIGTDKLVIQKKSSHMIRYDFPDNLSSPIRTKYRGQEQWWFHLHFLSNAQADLSKSEGEFRNLDWWSASEILNHIIDWKRQAYEDGFRALNFLGD